eukprot:2120306-Pyramimonas_sp.AAC.1
MEGFLNGVQVDGVGGSDRIADASATSAMHRHRRRGGSHRATSAMHQRCGAILRPHPLGPLG